MFWKKKERETPREMSPDLPDTIIISDQPVDREWRGVVETLEDLLSQANAAMQNAELAQTGRLSGFRLRSSSAESRMNVARLALYDIRDVVLSDSPEEEKSFIPVDDGIGTDLEGVLVVRTEVGTGKTVHVRFVGDVDDRISLFHREHIGNKNEGRAVYWTYDPGGLREKLGIKRKSDGRTEILRVPLRDYHDIATAVEELRHR